MLDTVGRGQIHASAAPALVAVPVYQADDRASPALGKRAPNDQLRPGERSTPPVRLSAPCVLPRGGRQILAEFPPAEVDQLVGQRHARAPLSLDWSKYRFIHIATTASVDAQVPQLSALILGSYDASGTSSTVRCGCRPVAPDTRRTLRCSARATRPRHGHKCQRGPGRHQLNRACPGCARGGASLWPVSDEMCARLMTEVYRHCCTTR